jgi:hypothetical protein
MSIAGCSSSSPQCCLRGGSCVLASARSSDPHVTFCYDTACGANGRRPWVGSASGDRAPERAGQARESEKARASLLSRRGNSGSDDPRRPHYSYGREGALRCGALGAASRTLLKQAWSCTLSEGVRPASRRLGLLHQLCSCQPQPCREAIDDGPHLHRKRGRRRRYRGREHRGQRSTRAVAEDPTSTQGSGRAPSAHARVPAIRPPSWLTMKRDFP